MRILVKLVMIALSVVKKHAKRCPLA